MNVATSIHTEMHPQVGTPGKARSRLSVLDFGQRSGSQSQTEAVRDTLALAERADELGFRRFWVAEHHGVPWLASIPPAVLLAAVGARTKRIRLGAGGVMLSNHAALVVAEQFALLEGLYPGRIDLGVGRAPGAEPAVAAALRRTREGLSLDGFRRQVIQTAALLADVSSPAVIAGAQQQEQLPPTSRQPPTWLLGSSTVSAQLAGELGLPFCFAAHNGASRHTVQAALHTYRSTFTDHHDRPAERPYTMITATAVTGESAQEADYLARPGRLQRFCERTGAPVRPFASPRDAAAIDLGRDGEQQLAAMPVGGAIGTPTHVAEAFDELITETGVDELLLCSFVYGRATRVRTLELLAAAWS